MDAPCGFPYCAFVDLLSVFCPQTPPEPENSASYVHRTEHMAHLSFARVYRKSPAGVFSGICLFAAACACNLLRGAGYARKQGLFKGDLLRVLFVDGKVLFRKEYNYQSIIG